MKKSKNVILSAVLLAAISSCSNRKNEWSYGKDANGRTRDTTVYRDGGYHYYRYYGGGWYPLMRNNMINTTQYVPASYSQISNSGFSSRAASGSVRSGGFGSTAHGSSGGG